MHTVPKPTNPFVYLISMPVNISIITKTSRVRYKFEENKEPKV